MEGACPENTAFPILCLAHAEAETSLAKELELPGLPVAGGVDGMRYTVLQVGVGSDPNTHIHVTTICRRSS